MADVRIYTKRKGAAASSGVALGTGAVSVNLSPFLRKDDAEAVYLSRDEAARVYLRRAVLDDMFTKVCVQEAKDAVTDADGNVTQAAVAAKFAIRANYDMYGVGGVSAYGYSSGSALGTGAGVSSFAELAEVAALTAADGQVWGYKDGAYKWITPAVTGGASGATRFADLTDIAGGIVGQVWGRKIGGYGWVDMPTGGTVSVEQVLDSGTRIATINGTAIYAPSAGAAVDLSGYAKTTDIKTWANGQFCTKDTFRGHTHTTDEITDLADEFVTVGQKSDHTHTRSQITDFAHTHTIAQVTGLADRLDNIDTAIGSLTPSDGDTQTYTFANGVTALGMSVVADMDYINARVTHPDLSDYAKTADIQAWVTGRGYLTKSAADGYYQPRGIYLTEHQSLSGYATEAWVEAKGYLAALPSHTHSQYAETADLATVATTGKYTDLIGKPDMTPYDPADNGVWDAINGKADLGHTHVKADIEDFAHTHPFTEITGKIAAGQIADGSIGNAKLAGSTMTLWGNTVALGGACKGKIHLGAGAGNTSADGTIEWDAANGCLKINGSVYATGGVSAYGYSSGDALGTGAGVSYLADLMDVDGGGSVGQVLYKRTATMYGWKSLGALAVKDAVTWGEVTGKPTLATVATTGSYADLTGRPSIPAAVRVKGASETAYRTGDVNLTCANIGAAAADHTHTQYALTSHTHSQYLTSQTLASLTVYSGTSADDTGSYVGMYSPSVAKTLYLGLTPYAKTADIQAWAGGQFCAKSEFDGHTHVWADIDDRPAALRNPYALTVKMGGTTAATYDGSAARSIDITPSAIGAAAAAHNHDWSDITSGTPTKLAGYGIEDAVTINTQQEITGKKIFTAAYTEVNGTLRIGKDGADANIEARFGGAYYSIFSMNRNTGNLFFNYGRRDVSPVTFGGTSAEFVAGSGVYLARVQRDSVEFGGITATTRYAYMCRTHAEFPMVKIGGAYLSWDGQNNALKIADADGGGSVNLYATGGISAYGGLGTYETVPNAHVTGQLKVGGSVVLENSATGINVNGKGITNAGAVAATSVTATSVSAATVTINGNQIRELSHSGSYIYINIGGTRYKVSATAG